MRAFDEARHVGHDEAAVVAQGHDAQVRRQRRERVVGDLRPRGRDARDERGLAGVREADETDVGQELELQPQLLRLAGHARVRAARRAVRGGREAGVAAAALAAGRDEDTLARLGQVGQLDQLSAVLDDLVDHRADRHLQHEGLAVAAVPVRAHAVLAALRLEPLVEAVADERVHVGAGDEEDRAAVAAVAAAGPAAWHELLAAERDAPAPAGPGLTRVSISSTNIRHYGSTGRRDAARAPRTMLAEVRPAPDHGRIGRSPLPSCHAEDTPCPNSTVARSSPGPRTSGPP